MPQTKYGGQDGDSGIGPIAVDPEVGDRGIGRSLMQEVLDHLAARNVAGVRLVAAPYNNRALCLYTKLGFRAREPLSVVQGPALGISFAGYEVRPGTEADIGDCERLCRQVHGFDRGAELRDAVAAQSAKVVGRLGGVTGYATGAGIAAHAVAETNRDLKALIAAAPELRGPGFLLPTRNCELFAWCLDNYLRLVM